MWHQGKRAVKLRERLRQKMVCDDWEASGEQHLNQQETWGGVCFERGKKVNLRKSLYLVDLKFNVVEHVQSEALCQRPRMMVL